MYVSGLLWIGSGAILLSFRLKLVAVIRDRFLSNGMWIANIRVHHFSPFRCHFIGLHNDLTTDSVLHAMQGLTHRTCNSMHDHDPRVSVHSFVQPPYFAGIVDVYISFVHSLV